MTNPPAVVVRPPRPASSAQPQAHASAERHLMPGMCLTPDRDETVVAVAGTGVVVCLWDPRRHAGGACHFAMPHPVSEQRTDGRFGTHAVPRLLEAMQAAGSRLPELRARVFGGCASPFASFRGTAMDMGRQNLEIARRLLEDHRILDLCEYTGTSHGLKVRFHTGPGDIHFTRLPESDEVRA